jgi:hypothetical protein
LYKGKEAYIQLYRGTQERTVWQKVGVCRLKGSRRKNEQGIYRYITKMKTRTTW